MESDEGVLMMNSSVVAFKQLQKEMKEEAEKSGLITEDDVVELCREVRTELSEKRNPPAARPDERVGEHDKPQLY